MPSFISPLHVQDALAIFFGKAPAFAAPVNITVELLDGNAGLTGLGKVGYVSPTASSANWTQYQLGESCGGSPSYKVNQAGWIYDQPLDFGTVDAGDTWDVRYASVRGDGIEMFRVDLGTEVTFDAGENVVIPANELRIGIEYSVV